ncbi:hypothetical protein EON62_02285 [archaeon]|nr:MAG: hypothetical protein EON62_02285 [archaeon]
MNIPRAAGFGSMAFNAMASSMYHDAGHTFRDPDGSSRFVCNGPVCFEKTFTTSGVLCIFFTLIPTLVLLWFLARQKKASGAQERVSMASLHDAVEGANQLSSQVEIDMELIHMDETADTGAHDLLDIIRHKSSARRAAPVASGSKA